jgi:hypothetical protein
MGGMSIYIYEIGPRNDTTCVEFDPCGSPSFVRAKSSHFHLLLVSHGTCL